MDGRAVVSDRPGHAAIVVEGLVKTFGVTRALDDVSFTAPRGQVLGLLGPNGSGKTTTVRILATLTVPDAGRACVDGLDVVAQAAAVREVIGLAGQYAAVDEYLTGRENLRLVAGLYHLGRAAVLERSDELLELFDLKRAGARQVRTYSGGMRRRLDLAASLVNRPRVLFLDEPTTGLDPRSRAVMWDAIRRLASDGTTILLTTQYLEEADQLCGQLVVLDHGAVIAAGRPDELKAQIGGDVVALTVEPRSNAPAAAAALSGIGVGEPVVDIVTGRVTVPVGGRGAELLGQVVRLLDDALVEVSDIGVRRPSLNEVFLALTGHSSDDEPSGTEDSDRGAPPAQTASPVEAAP